MHLDVYRDKFLCRLETFLSPKRLRFIFYILLYGSIPTDRRCSPSTWKLYTFNKVSPALYKLAHFLALYKLAYLETSRQANARQTDKQAAMETDTEADHVSVKTINKGTFYKF